MVVKVAYFKNKEDDELVAVFDTNCQRENKFVDGYAYTGQHTPIHLDYLRECELIPENEKPIDKYGNLHTHLVEVVGYDDLRRDNSWILEKLGD